MKNNYQPETGKRNAAPLARKVFYARSTPLRAPVEPPV
jgi:hypothetical protein